MSRTYRRKKGQQCSLIGVPGWIDETIEEYNSPWLKKFHWDRNKYTCHNKIKGYQATALDENNVSHRINLGEVETQGFELETTWAPVAGLSLLYNIAFMDTLEEFFLHLCFLSNQKLFSVTDNSSLSWVELSDYK